MSASVMTETAPATPPAQARRVGPGWFWAAIVVGGLVVLSIGPRRHRRQRHRLLGRRSCAAIGLAVPIGLAGLGGLWSERAGVVNIGLEGMMILGTWGAAFFGYHYGPWAGILGAILTGVVGGAHPRPRHGGLRRRPHRLRCGAQHPRRSASPQYLAVALLHRPAGWRPDAVAAAASSCRPSRPRASPTRWQRSSSKHWFFVSDLAGVLRGCHDERLRR